MRLIGISIRFLACYFALLAACTATPLGRTLASTCTTISTFILGLCLGQDVNWGLVGDIITVSVPVGDGTATLTHLPYVDHIRNVPMCIAALCAVGRYPGRELLILCSAVGATALIVDACVIAAHAWPAAVRFGAWYNALATISEFHGLGVAGMFAVPLFLAVGSVRIVRPRFRISSVTEAPRRNAPCPCGSGSKFKRCCME